MHKHCLKGVNDFITHLEKKPLIIVIHISLESLLLVGILFFNTAYWQHKHLPLKPMTSCKTCMTIHMQKGPLDKTNWDISIFVIFLSPDIRWFVLYILSTNIGLYKNNSNSEFVPVVIEKIIEKTKPCFINRLYSWHSKSAFCITIFLF